MRWYKTASTLLESVDLPDGSKVTLNWDKHAWGSGGSGYSFHHTRESQESPGIWETIHRSRPYPATAGGEAAAQRAFRAYVARKSVASVVASNRRLAHPSGSDKMLRMIRDRIETADRKMLLLWLKWNDPNGAYTDADVEVEGIQPLTDEAARQLARETFFDPGHMSQEEKIIYREQIERWHPEKVVDPMARMYDLRKKGPDLTPEEDAELRGLIGRHGRPKFMASRKS